jgi:hypothetical protein
MFINQSFVAIAFKFINFFAIIGLGFYIFKKYLKTDLLFSIAKKEADYQDLIAQQSTLENKQHELDFLIKQQLIQCQDLRSKIDEWSKAILLEHDKQKKEQNDLIAAIKKRATEIAEKKQYQHVQNVILKTVIVDLEKSLIDHFKNPQKSSNYVDAIVHFMNEKIS